MKYSTISWHNATYHYFLGNPSIKQGFIIIIYQGLHYLNYEVVGKLLVLVHWIGLRENLQETMVFTIKHWGFLMFPVNFPVNQSNDS